MIIVLARHGNTFNPGDRVYRVGKRNDLPLTNQGHAQAELFADALTSKKMFPCVVYCSPLQRTQQFAQTIINKMSLNICPQIDERVTELDYGNWAGLTDEEVATQHPDEFKAWKEKSSWPKNSGWPETEAAIIDSTKHFVYDLANKYNPDDIVFVVSSCGRLRYFLKLVDDAFENRLQSVGVTVKTGNACKISYQNKKFKIEQWNVNPTELEK